MMIDITKSSQTPIIYLAKKKKSQILPLIHSEFCSSDKINSCYYDAHSSVNDKNLTGNTVNYNVHTNPINFAFRCSHHYITI